MPTSKDYTVQKYFNAFGSLAPVLDIEYGNTNKLTSQNQYHGPGLTGTIRTIPELHQTRGAWLFIIGTTPRFPAQAPDPQPPLRSRHTIFLDFGAERGMDLDPLTVKKLGWEPDI
ncbi:hypothetical protein I7I51_03642 [Histoplasma capsulatum]|uniref:Uncharacterized protein n=1 Tax=Ajellomyces capsulatus TaxID=5037 RepID=A0A8A1MBD0_AJECA|nr:hypothetical protein I7I51_03642 [Histoplasma capsulatum]